MRLKLNHLFKVATALLVLGSVSLYLALAPESLAAPAPGIDGGSGGSGSAPSRRSDPYLRSPESMEAPTGCYSGGTFFDFGEQCSATERLSDCWSIAYTCKASAQCTADDVFKAAGGSCSDPAGGLRSTCCDPAAGCDGRGTCAQGPAVSCPPEDLVLCRGYRCNCANPGTCEGFPLNPLRCRPTTGACYCVYNAISTSTADGNAECSARCNSIGASASYYDTDRYCVCTSSNSGSCPNSATGQSLDIGRTYPSTCATLSISWAAPAAITYGDGLPAAHLNAVVSPSGASGTIRYTYNGVEIRAGHQFSAGDHEILATFTPSNTRNFSPVSAKITQRVLKRRVSFSFPSARKVYGDPNPTLTFTPSADFVLGDSFASVFGSIQPTTTATQYSPVSGTYPITMTLPPVANYEPVIVGGSFLTIERRPTTCSTLSKRVPVGTEIAAMGLQFNCNNLAGSDNNSIFSPTMTVANYDKTKAQNYTITFSRAPSHPNYTVTNTFGTLSVYADCVVSAWNVPANPACGTSYLATRTITTQPANGGAACPHLTETRTAPACCGTSVGTRSISCWYRTGAGSGCTCQPETSALPSPYSTLLTSIANTNAGFFGCNVNAEVGDSRTARSGANDGRLTYLGYQDAGSVVGGNPLTQASYLYILDVTDVSACVKNCVQGPWYDSPAGQPTCGVAKTQQRDTTQQPAYGGTACGPSTQSVAQGPCGISVSWDPPASIVYGTSLPAAHLNAKASYNGSPVDGTFTYSQPAGKVLSAGTNPISATFAPKDPARFSAPAAVSVNQVVTKRPLECNAPTLTMKAGTNVPTLTITCQNSFAPGESMASLVVPGSLTIGSANTAIAGDYPITFSAAPGSSNYDVKITNGLLKVQSDCVLGDYEPKTACKCGAANFSQTQTIVTPAQNGGACNPATRTVVCPRCALNSSHPFGRNNIAALFGLGLNDKVGILLRHDNLVEVCRASLGATTREAVSYANYQYMKFSSAGDNQFCGFSPLRGTDITFQGKTCGAADSDTPYLSQLDCLCNCAYASVCGNGKYEPTNNEECDGAAFPAGVPSTTGCTANCKLFSKNTPVISWAKPADIIYGEALGPQLNARALFNGTDVSGKFTYAPASGAILAVGPHTLTANFDPTSTSQYNSAAPASVQQVVVKKQIPCLIADASRVYGETSNPTPTFSCTGFVGNDTQASIFGSRVPTSTANQTSAAGSNQSYTLSLPSSANYEFVVSGGKLTITARPLEVIVDAKSRAVGVDNPPFTYRYVGFANGDAETKAGTLVTTATKSSPIGSYDITFSAKPTVSANYTLKETLAKLTVGGAVVSCTVNAASRLYGDANPNFTFSCLGFLSPDTQASVFGTTAPSTTAVGTSPVGNNYDIILTAPQSNKYTFNISNAKLTINAAPLSCNGVGFTRRYGEQNKALTTACTGYKLSDGPSILSSTGTFNAVPAVSADADTYTIGYEQDPVANSNYTVTVNPAKVVIEQQPVACQAHDKSMIVNGTIPPLTHYCTGLVLSQSEAIFGTPPLEVDGPTNTVGTPKIKYTAALTHKNYLIKTTPGTMTVTGKTPTSCTWAKPAALMYGTGILESTFTTNGAKVDQNVAGRFTYSHAAGRILDVGSTPMTATFVPDLPGQYEGCTCTTEQVVNASTAITCEGSVQSRRYGDTNGAFTFKCTEGTGADASGRITNASSVTFAAGPASNAAVQSAPYEVAFATAPTAGSNYAIKLVPAKVTVTQRPLSCKPNAVEIALGSSAPTVYGATCTGFATGETRSTLTTPGVVKVVGDPSRATVGGTYDLVFDPAPTSGNYNITVEKGVLTVNQLKVTWAPAALEVNKAVGAAQLNAGNDKAIPGKYTYSKASGSYATAGDYPETVDFVPDNLADQTKYGAKIRGNATIKVFKNCVLGGYPTPACGTGTQTLTQIVLEPAANGGTCSPGTQTVTAPLCATTCTWAKPAAITYGTGLPVATFTTNGAQETSPANGTFTYSHSAGQVLNGGDTIMTATFNPDSPTQYSRCSVSVTQTVNPANTSCTMSNASAFVGDTLGTNLISAQVSGGIAGRLTYTYTMGSQTLTAGTALTTAGTVSVTARFAPDVPSNYNGSTCTATLSVVSKQQATCTLSPLTLRTDQSVTQSALEAKSTGSTGTQTISGTWSYKYRSTGAPVAMGTTLAKGSYLIDATWTLPANSGWNSATCSGTIYVGACTPSTQATDCNDNNSCTTDTCSVAGVCSNRYLGSQGSLSPTMTLACPGSVTVNWNDILRCVNPTESPTYAIGLDSLQAISLPNNPGNLVAMDKTKFAPATVCANGVCSKTFTVPSINLEKTKTVYGGVASFLSGVQDKLNTTSAAGICDAKQATCTIGTLNLTSTQALTKAALEGVSTYSTPGTTTTGTWSFTYASSGAAVSFGSTLAAGTYAINGTWTPSSTGWLPAKCSGTVQVSAASNRCRDQYRTRYGFLELEEVVGPLNNTTSQAVCESADTLLRAKAGIMQGYGYEVVFDPTVPTQASGTWTCTARACLWSTAGNPNTGGAPNCGNGVIDAGETCDLGNGAAAGCKPGCKCNNCQLDCQAGGCKTLLGIRCTPNGTGTSPTVPGVTVPYTTCERMTAWGPSAIRPSYDGLAVTDCREDNCCPPAGQNTTTLRYADGVGVCVNMRSACAVDRGTDPPNFRYTHSKTIHNDENTGEVVSHWVYTCIEPGTACDCSGSPPMYGCPTSPPAGESPQPK